MNSAGFDKQQGTSLVEFVLIAPLMLLILFALMEFGRAIYQYNILNKAVRDGSIYAAHHILSGSSLSPIYDADIAKEESNIKNLVVYGIPAGGTSPLLPDWSTGNVSIAKVDLDSDGNYYHIAVTATYTYSPILGGGTLPTFGLGDGPIDLNFDFTSTVTARAL